MIYREGDYYSYREGSRTVAVFKIIESNDTDIIWLRMGWVSKLYQGFWHKDGKYTILGAGDYDMTIHKASEKEMEMAVENEI